jgi:hypothetical protein
MSIHHGGRTGYEVAMSISLPGGVRRSDPHSAMIVDLPCSKCGMVEQAWRSGNIVPPDIVAKKLQRQGWRLGNKAGAHLCPYHRKEKEEMTKPKLIAGNDTALSTGTVIAEDSLTSDQTRKARRDALDLLDCNFNVETGQFKAGESDATIAELTGLSEKAVADLREQFYGPVKEDPEARKLRHEITALAGEIVKEERRSAEAIAKMRQELEGLSKLADRVLARWEGLRPAK